MNVLYISPPMKGQKIDKVELSYQGLQFISFDTKKIASGSPKGICLLRISLNVKCAYPRGDRKKLIGSQDTKFICQKGLNSLVLLMRCLDAARRSIKINRVISVKVTSDREIHGNHTIRTQCRCIIINAVCQRVIYCASLDYLV